MNFIETAIPDVVIFEPSVFEDARGCFFESYNEAAFAENGIMARFVQDNQSESRYGVIRGLHGQAGAYAQAKLVRVLSGAVLDVAVDVRAGSKTFGQYVAVELSEKNKRQLFIPKGFLHGFSALSQAAVFFYKVDQPYCKEAEFGVRYDDPELAINWQVPSEKQIISDKDQLLGCFKNVPYYRR